MFDEYRKEVELADTDITDTPAEPAAEETAAEETVDEDAELYVRFRRPFVFEDETYEGVDLSGLEDLSARDMIATQRVMERSGSINVIPEMSLEYACIFVSKATKLPVEFFQSLPPREAVKVKNRVTSFFYGED